MLGLNKKIPVLDHGYVKYIGHMGDDELIIESARMSVGKGFFGWYWKEDTWADGYCRSCDTQHLMESLPLTDDLGLAICTNCWESGVNDIRQPALGPIEPKLLGKKGQPRDFGLLEFMYTNRHMSPFESGELMIEVYAPLMVFREWQRARTQSYNEFSARYAQMPNAHYVPDISRIQKQSKINKQGSAESFNEEQAEIIIRDLAGEQSTVYRRYDDLVRNGLAKEVARLNTPVSRYSKMRAKANLRNWLWFLGLRMEKGAQWEIRCYANIVAAIIKEIWPKTFDLFIEHDFLAVRFSRNEMHLLRAIVRGDITMAKIKDYAPAGTSLGICLAEGGTVEVENRAVKRLIDKLTKSKEDDYKDVLAKLGY